GSGGTRSFSSVGLLGGRKRLGGENVVGGCRFGRVFAAARAAEHVAADHLDQVHRRGGEGDFLARLQRFHVAARLPVHVALAQQPAGEDRGRGIDRQL